MPLVDKPVFTITGDLKCDLKLDDDFDLMDEATDVVPRSLDLADLMAETKTLELCIPGTSWSGKPIYAIPSDFEELLLGVTKKPVDDARNFVSNAER